MLKALGAYYPESGWQRCTVHFYRNVWAKVPHSKIKEVVAMLKAVHAQEDSSGRILSIIMRTFFPDYFRLCYISLYRFLPRFSKQLHVDYRRTPHECVVMQRSLEQTSISAE